MKSKHDLTPFEASQRIHQCTSEWHRAWHQGNRPNLNEWLEKYSDIASEVLPQLVAIELEYRLRMGEKVLARDYLQRYAILQENPQQSISLIGIEFRVRKEREPFLQESDFKSSYPEWMNHPDWSNGPWVNPSLPTPVIPHENDQTTAQNATPPTTTKPVGSFPMSVFDHPIVEGDLGQFGEYRVLSILGGGGMGIVLRGIDPQLNRQVALKLIRPELGNQSEAKERFLREARVLAEVEHPRIVTLYRVGQHRDVLFLVMPLLKGDSLGNYLKAGKNLTLRETVRIVREAAEGLSIAHARGLIHRDIKPDNLWVEETDDGIHVRLLDFGLARPEEDATLTQTGAILGTPAYMAPEQAEGQTLSPKADLFSLGVVLYEMTTGKRPFSGPSMMAILDAVRHQQPIPVQQIKPGIPQPLIDLIDQMLTKNPSQRNLTAREIVDRLQAIESKLPELDSTITGYSQTKSFHINPPTNPPRRSHKRLLLFIGGIFGVGLLLWSLIPPRTTNPDLGGGTTPIPPSDPKLTPFRVTGLDVDHFRKRGKQEGELTGAIGRASFSPELGDWMKMHGQLNRPGYSYLLVFRPDGMMELCYPDDENTPPKLREEARYPTNSENRDEAYRLNEGTGLWVVTMVSSEKPLPAFQEWLQNRKPPWKPEKSPPQMVWIDDGQWVEVFGPRGPVRGDRAKGEKLPGQSSVVQLSNWLQSIDKNVSVWSIGFTVVEPEKP